MVKVVKPDSIINAVDPTLLEDSGAVFYSGRTAFRELSNFYVLGISPGGDPAKHATNTVSRSIESWTVNDGPWSSYLDEDWGTGNGAARMQRRTVHLLQSLGLEPRQVPSSNVIFVRTSRERYLAEKDDLLLRCWPFHDMTIHRLAVKALLCFGQTPGLWVRKKLGANTLVGEFVEANKRRWKNQAHKDGDGRLVFTLTHLSIADWFAPSTDPTPMVRQLTEHLR